MQKFLSELQRRKVLRVASGYVVAAWIILQVALALQGAMKLPDWFSTVIVSLLIIGFPIAVIVSWFFEFTPEGIKRTAPSSEVARFKPQTTDFALAGALVLVLAAVLARFNRCIELEPYSFSCNANRVGVLGALGRDAEALAAYRKMLDAGTVSFYFAWHILARTGQEDTFKTAANAPNVLFGWRRHDELYEAHRRPERTYPELVADIRKFDEKRETGRIVNLGELLIPLGAYDLMTTYDVIWDASFAGFRRSPQFKARVKGSGVLDYWRKHGFPPQCRAVGTDDFVCD